MVTAKVARVALPDHAGQKYGHDLLSGLLEPGTYAVDPGDGRPWRSLQPEPEEQGGVRLQTYSVTGPPDRIGVAPGDVRGTVFIPEQLGGCCCGWDGQYGPNLACAECGRPVASRIDDCGFWQVVWLEPDAVRPVAVAGPVQRVTGPRHPQTGELWPCDAGAVVPLAADVWTYLAFHELRQVYGMPAGVRRDDPPPLLPTSLFRADGRVFVSTLKRLAARQPWVRRVYDRMTDRPYEDPFW
ncbi:hypothetical protein AB0C28_42765 [Nonomuraea sp. NPDC048892]|uniref:hypothetical protein n=1 Tax=Nonomuraea sp. NPDC048892 TaxID=3154624 RepID=UPI003408E371